MNDLTYSAGKMKNKKMMAGLPSFIHFENPITIKEILEENYDLKKISREEFIMAYCQELKEILGMRDLSLMIQSILALESDLMFIHEAIKDIKNLPRLRNFFIQLSPLLMQSFLEIKNNEDDEEAFHEGWIEAFRIALEEEIYIWQEKID